MKTLTTNPVATAVAHARAASRFDFLLRCIGAFCIGYLAMAGYLAQIGRMM